MSTARPVTFTNPAGCRLVGILHEPRHPRADVAVILLSPGVKSRVAPHRLYSKMTSMLLGLGLRVLRFDFYGLGDSEGEIDQRVLEDFYGSVQEGRYVEDTRAAIAWMVGETGVDAVILGGLCGGAITGLLAGAEHERVAGLLSLGLPIVRHGTGADEVAHMTAGQLEGIRARYLSKLRDPRSWARLLTFKTDHRLLARALFRSRAATDAGPSAESEAAAVGRVSPGFRPAFVRMLSRRRPVLLLFSGSDRLYWEFQERYAVPCAGEVASFADQLDIAVVPEANHIFSFGEWQQEMLRLSRSWVERRFGTGGQAGTVAAGALEQATGRPSPRAIAR